MSVRRDCRRRNALECVWGGSERMQAGTRYSIYSNVQLDEFVVMPNLFMQPCMLPNPPVRPSGARRGEAG